MASTTVGIAAYGLYLPDTFMTAADVARASNGQWSEAAVREKLGFDRKTVPGPDDGTQAMGVRAARDCLRRFRYDPEKIDVILCIGEEWKEYPLTTSGIYIQEQIGAQRAWALDVQQRCCSLISAMKIARDLIVADDEVDSVMVVGGYRNGDFVDYANPRMSMMYNLAAGACAVILERDAPNALLATRVMSDGSMARDVGCRIGGTVEPITHANVDAAYRSLDLMDAEHMKARLNDVSMGNWLACVDGALGRARLSRRDIGYLAVLHFKPSMHRALLDELGLADTQTTYLRDYGHLGQIDQILSLDLGLRAGKVADGTIVCMLAAGIGYAWAANVVRWGAAQTS